MFRLAVITLLKSTNNKTILFSIISIALCVAWFLLARKGESGKNRTTQLMTAAIAIAAVALTINWLLKTFTIYTLASAMERFIVRSGSLLTRNMSFSSFFDVFRMHSATLIILAGALIILLFLYFLLKNVRFTGLEERCMHVITKYALKAALFSITFLLIMNFSIFIDAKMHAPKGPNIIIILIDALRKDHAGIYGYGRKTTPNIDDFCEDSIVFQNAFSQCPWTSPSVASLFSSLYPFIHGVTSYSEMKADALHHKIATFAELLKDKGYATGAFTANHWISKGLLFDQGFDVFDPINKKDKPLASELNKKALKWIGRNKKRPFFAYLHYMGSADSKQEKN